MTSHRRPLFESIFGRLNTLVVFLLLVSSCVSQKNVEYLRLRDKSIRSFSESEIGDYRLKPNDELYIQISSLDDAATNMFTSNTAQQFLYVGTMQPYGASLLSHSVDKDGFLLLPVVGRLSVKDKTTAEVGQMIASELANVLSQPIVTVKLVNRYISVLGEVRNPGHFPYAQDKLTIYDALGLAGDITDYGNRNEVVLTRNENGKNIRIPVDLTRSDILASPHYYLRPNDMVYVKPLRKKFWGMRQFPFTVLLSAITTTVLVLNYIE